MSMSTGVPSRLASETDSIVRPVAVVDIGATSIRMEIAEIGVAGTVRPLENLSQAVSLGKDTFTLRRIRKSSIEACVRVLKSYRKLLNEYGITQPDQMRIVATSAVREATNRLAFIDRVYIATGLVVEALDEAEVNRITYMGIQPLLRQDPSLATSKAVIAEIGSGSTEVLMVRSGNVLFSNTYRLGSLRILETIGKSDAPRAKQLAIMESQILRVVEQIREQLDSTQPLEMIGIGGDMRFAAANLIEDWETRKLASMPVDSLWMFTRRILPMSPDEVAQRFGIAFQDAETIGPALLSYVLLAKELKCEQIRVAETNLRDGLLHDLAQRDVWTAEFRNQIVRSAINLGRRFAFDETHARHVAMLSRKLFSELQAEHQLDSRMELLLYVSALLHEIGLYVNVRSNHKHAMYIIRNSELFGLSRKDVLLVALVARYHRRSSPQPDHEGYLNLDRNDRVAVAKLASLLRLAIALDESRSQRVSNIRCKVDSNRLVVTTHGVEDISLEQLALRQTSNLFEETFGLNVLLRTSRR
jgi:exopolyphosphatase/guanosine-5'-triphosphate,3'-diphosphate pyrophosphatase